MKCGIVGLPNVGKSTLFNALTKAGIAAENYPFCTIEPNVGIVPVPDLRLDAIAGIAQPQKVVPALVTEEEEAAQAAAAVAPSEIPTTEQAATPEGASAEGEKAGDKAAPNAEKPAAADKGEKKEKK